MPASFQTSPISSQWAILANIKMGNPGRGRVIQRVGARYSHCTPSKRYSSSSSSSPVPPPRPGFFARLRKALRETPVRWAPIPIAGGAILLVALDLWKKRSPRRVDAIMQDGTYDMSKENLPQVKGPWQVHVIGALPLRTLSRIYGSLNEYTLPVWFRVPGFKLYAWIFGVNLEEAEITDLKQYRSLSEFFMRRLKDGARPVDDYALVSPADGRVVNFGYIENRRIQQVKGVTYSLDSFLSGSGPQQSADNNESHIIPNKAKAPTRPGQTESDNAVVNEQEFANLNGLSYTVDQLVGNEPHSNKDPEGHDSDHGKQVVRPHAGTPHDASVPPTAADHSKPSSVGEVEQHSLSDQISLAAKTFDPLSPHWTFRGVPKEGNAMYFCVIYLAPGDYHRFHSPTNWVVERRRHFAGELFSVSPYMSKLLKDLFILNERVALLGRWRHGFFSMTPVGATNVGSIRINFDADLRTNSPTRPSSAGEYAEATYAKSSAMLQGKPLRAGEEVGVFALGSTIVLLFEAPENMIFTVRRGDKVKVGECIADMPDKLQKYFQAKKSREMTWS